MDHPLRCTCGKVRGHVKAGAKTNRGVCYCKDCRAFARYFGPSAGILDAHGGTHVVQTVQANVAITQGRDELACLRLTERGLLRWYAQCCSSPIGNTPADWRLSLVGLVQTCLERADGPSVDESFGPVRMVAYTESALGAMKPRSRGLVRGIARVVAMLLRARLDGSYRRTPFFSADDGTPIAAPRVLSAAEREALRDDPA